MCPHCGYDLELDAPITSRGLYLDPRGAVSLNGQSLPIPYGQRAVLHTIMKAGGRCVSEEVLRERTGYEGDHNVIHVHIRRLRVILAANGIHDAIKNIRGVGYYWNDLSSLEAA